MDFDEWQMPRPMIRAAVNGLKVRHGPNDRVIRLIGLAKIMEQPGTQLIRWFIQTIIRSDLALDVTGLVQDSLWTLWFINSANYGDLIKRRASSGDLRHGTESLVLLKLARHFDDSPNLRHLNLNQSHHSNI